MVAQIIARENPEGPVSDVGNDVSDCQETTTEVPQDTSLDEETFYETINDSDMEDFITAPTSPVVEQAGAENNRKLPLVHEVTPRLHSMEYTHHRTRTRHHKAQTRPYREALPLPAGSGGKIENHLYCDNPSSSPPTRPASEALMHECHDGYTIEPNPTKQTVTKLPAQSREHYIIKHNAGETTPSIFVTISSKKVELRVSQAGIVNENSQSYWGIFYNFFSSVKYYFPSLF